MESSGGHKEHVHHIQTHTCPHGHAKMHVGKQSMFVRKRNSKCKRLLYNNAVFQGGGVQQWYMTLGQQCLIGVMKQCF